MPALHLQAGLDFRSGDPQGAAVSAHHRYSVVNVAWRRRGERQGLLRKRRWQQRTWEVGTADDLQVATQLLAHAPLSWDEAVFVYDRLHPDFARGNAICVASRMGQEWNGRG